jgi:trans-aconitate 2-methyltransferase
VQATTQEQDPWDPAQYNKFREQRMLPFFDLFALIRPRPGMRVIDLGCGTGELTEMLSQRLVGARIEGVDASASMLEQALPRAGERLTFHQGDMREIADFSPYDLVFSNAALQWVPDNESLLARISSQLRPEAQVAIQVPKRGGSRTGAITGEVLQEPRFQALIRSPNSGGGALSLERYSQLLHEHGFREQACIEKIYGHELAHVTDVIEFIKGTGLGQYLVQLDEAGQAAFVASYRARLLEMEGDKSPYFFQMPRLLFWGQKMG